MTIQEIQALPYGEIVAKLDAIAPQYLEARERLKQLGAEQTLYLNARALHEAGLNIGDTVQVTGYCSGRRNPKAVVVEPFHGELQFQAIGKDGLVHGDPSPAWSLEAFEIVDK